MIGSLRGMRALALGLAAGLLAAPPSAGDAPDPGRAGPRAPEIRCEHWINSRPLRPADLRGKVVVVEFWTFDCINCLRTLPAMKALRKSLPESEVVIVGVHTPELDHERNLDNVRRAVTRLGVSYPVAFDGDYAVWRSFGNRYWPALYVIDRRGVIRHTHVGELHRNTPAWNQVIGVIERLRREPS